MMQNSRFKLSALAIATAMACSSAAFATNGYFVHGYGTKSSGMGGVGVALPQDALAAATNPAGMSWAGSRVDAGVMLFNPIRDGELDATFMGGADSKMDSGATLFLVPNAGFAMDMAGMTMGFAMYANGGMNTRYNGNIYNSSLAPAIGCTDSAAVCGSTPSGFAALLDGFVTNFYGGSSAVDIDPVLTGLYTNPRLSPATTLGVNLSQLILAPSASMKLGDSHSVGASLLVGYQRFRAYGLDLFGALSSDMNNLTNRGDDDAWGGGLRLGWTGNITDTLTLGATASSKIYMQKFSKYKGLFADNGAFDIPANFGLGLAFKPNDRLTLAFDVERILYSDVASINNPGPTADQLYAGLTQMLTSGTGSPLIPCGNLPVPVDCKYLGNKDGYGFGWESQTVYKLGAAYKYSDQWTLRAGFNYGESPIQNSQNLFNIIAPGVVEKHATLGFTFSPDKSSEISVGYMHAFRKEQSVTYAPSSTGSFSPANTGGPLSYDANIGMSQNSLEVSYGYKF